MSKPTFRRFANEYVVSLFPVHHMMDAFKYGLKQTVGRGCNILLLIENHAVSYYIDQEWQAAHETLVKKLKVRPQLLANAYCQIERLGRAQVRLTKPWMKGATRAGDRELAQRLTRFAAHNTKLYSYGLLLPLLDFQSTTFISDELKRILKKYTATEHFQLLVTSLRDTYGKRQELALLTLFKDMRAKSSLVQALQREETQAIIDVLQRRYPMLWRKLQRHAKQYAWVYYVYEGPAADEACFIDVLKDYARRNVDPQAELQRQVQEKATVKKEQARVIRSLPLTAYERGIVAVARDIVFFKAYRRELQSWSYYQMEPTLREIARRLHLSLRQVRMLLPEEIERALRTGMVDTRLIQERLKKVIYGYAPRRICLAGKKADAFQQSHIKKETKPRAVKELRGDTACPGTAQGTVRLINTPEDMKKMTAGAILVSASTNPNLMPAIRQAGAIVTDEGGLTCHAAIVSRELKIPCVVGVKIATRVLQDGDRVEVDAGQGTIKKL